LERVWLKFVSGCRAVVLITTLTPAYTYRIGWVERFFNIFPALERESFLSMRCTQSKNGE